MLHVYTDRIEIVGPLGAKNVAIIIITIIMHYNYSIVAVALI